MEGEFLKPTSCSKQSRPKQLIMKEVFRLRGKATLPEGRKRRPVRDRTRNLVALLCGTLFCFALLKPPPLAQNDQQSQARSCPISVRTHVICEAPAESLKTSRQTYQAPWSAGMATA